MQMAQYDATGARTGVPLTVPGALSSRRPSASGPGCMPEPLSTCAWRVSGGPPSWAGCSCRAPTARVEATQRWAAAGAWGVDGVAGGIAGGGRGASGTSACRRRPRAGPSLTGGPYRGVVLVDGRLWRRPGVASARPGPGRGAARRRLPAHTAPAIGLGSGRHSPSGPLRHRSPAARARTCPDRAGRLRPAPGPCPT